MKKIVLISVLLLNLSVAMAQNPFSSIGVKDKDVKVLTLSNGKYEEFEQYNRYQRVGSVVMDMQTMKIAYFIDRDTLRSEATLEPEVVSRWLSMDPLAAKYPNLSPYNFVGNNPLLFIDPDGRKILIAYTVESKDTKTGEVKVENKSFEYGSKLEVPNNEFVKNTIATLDKLSSSGADKLGIVNTLANDNSISKITETNFFNKQESNAAGAIEWNPNAALLTKKNGVQAPAVILLHELAHTYVNEYNCLEKDAPKSGMGGDDYLKKADEYEIWYKNVPAKWKNKEEKWIIENVENPASDKLGGDTRDEHDSNGRIEVEDSFSTTPIY